jgi:putative hydrolase of HD superfamily
MKDKLSELLNFSKILNAFQKVERVVRVPQSEKRENDVEHSYQLAMLAWYLADSNGLSLDKNLLLRYALVHDFVEVYAGDTPVYSKNQQDHDTKKRTRRIFTSSHRKRIPRV